MNVFWQLVAFAPVLNVLLLTTIIVYYGVRGYITARRFAPQYNYDLPAARPVVLVKLIIAELFAIAVAVFCAWCIFW